jgi:phosphate transport system substrate-binding protein
MFFSEAISSRAFLLNLQRYLRLFCLCMGSFGLGKRILFTFKRTVMTIFRMIRISLFFLAFVLGSCGGGGTDQAPRTRAENTPTTGQITMWSDEGLRPILTTMIDVFDSIYDKAKIDVEYHQEADIVNQLMTDSIEVAFLMRNLTAPEIDVFKKAGFEPRITLVAYDGMAVILHPSNRDTVFTVGEMKDILSGKVSTWKALNGGGPPGDIVFVFDQAGAGTVRFAKDSILQGESLSAKANALKTNEEVIEYVGKHPTAIGLISANWISDTDDTGVQTFLKNIRLAEIARETGKESFTPHQAYLATGDYPFKRGIWYIDATARNFGLATGFASFMAGDRGQRIILKSGLLPSTMPIRLIKVEKE